MPKVTKCIKGHFYDSERFDSCPYCVGSDGNDLISDSADGGQHTVPASHVAPGAAAGHTVPASSVMPAGHTVPAQTAPGRTVSSAPVVNVTQNAYSSLDNDVADAQKTVAKFATKNNGKEPVVGWLVCTEGKHYGEDFRLKAGNNFIGRDRSMDVVLGNDNSVSRNKHAIVIYDPVSNAFIVRAGESHELSYLNGQILLEPKALKAYDKLSVGSTTLMFVPLTGPEFTWGEK